MKQHHRSRDLRLIICFAILLPALVLPAQPSDDQAGDDSPPPVIEKTTENRDAGPEANAAVEPSNEEREQNRVDEREYREIVRFGSNATVREGEEVGEFVVIFGSGTIDGRVRGDAVVIGGTAKVNGQIDGNLVVPLGSVELGPKARVGENLVVVGGSLKADPDSKVEGGREVISWEEIEHNVPPIAGAKHWIMYGLILGRPLPHQAGWWWWVALGCAVVYLLTSLVFRRPIAASVGVLESRPVGSFFIGVLMFVLFVPLLVLLAATGVGLIVVPFVFCAALVALVFGKIAVYRLVGEQVGKQTGIGFFEQPVIALIIGIGILYVAYMIPIVGFLIWGLAAPLGFGAVTLAAFRAFRSESVKPGAPAGDSPSAGATASGLQPPLISSIEAGAPAGDFSLLPRAGFWIRFLATFLDLLLVGALTSVLHRPPVILLVWVAYHVGMWAWKGTTIGGVVFGLKVVRKDGRPVDFAVALVRSLASFFSALVLFLGFFWAGWNREKQSWHDMIAGTVVVKVPKGVSLL